MTAIVEFVIFTGLLYWFFTSSRIADMLEVMSAHVSRACGLGNTDERANASQLRRIAQRRRTEQFHDFHSNIEAEKIRRTAALYKSKETQVVPPPVVTSLPPTGLACQRCAPISRVSYQDTTISSRNPRDSSVLSVFDIGRAKYESGGLFSRYFKDIVRVRDIKDWDLPDVVPSVLKDDRFQRTIDDATLEEVTGMEDSERDRATEKEYQKIRSKVQSRAYKILMDMRATTSMRILRILAWVCYKLFPKFCHEGTWVRSSGLQSVKRAAASGLPMIFVPLHRSHIDYILLTLVLLLNEMRPPIVASGDNLKIPFFGWLLRNLGAFFIRRRAEGVEVKDDPLYNETLRSYILNSLEAKHYLEFFIEGGRTRTGKPQMPKAGILSVIIEAFNEGRIEDALLVPVTMNYSRLIDGNFVREQLGQPKKMETFWSPIQTLLRILRTNRGAISVHYNQPVSLKELITSYRKYNYTKPTIDIKLKLPNEIKAPLQQKALSNCSLYGSDISLEHKAMTESIATHLVYDASNATSIMSTSLVTFVLLTELRNGADLEQICEAVDRLAAKIRMGGRHIACNGHTSDVVSNAIDLLDGIVHRQNNGRYIISGSSCQVEAAYYASSIGTHLVPQAIVLTCLEIMIKENHESEIRSISRKQLVDLSVQLCQILSAEYILCPPCVTLRDMIDDTVDLIVERGILNTSQAGTGLEEEQWSRRFAKTLDYDDQEEEYRIQDIKYTIASDDESLQYRRSLLASLRPILECYTETIETLKDMAYDVRESGKVILKNKEVVMTTLHRLSVKVESHSLIFGEALSTDAIRNCLRFLKMWGIIDIYSQGRDRMITVKAAFFQGDCLEQINTFVARFNVQTELLKFS